MSPLQLANDLNASTLSFFILFASLALASYVLWRRYQSRRLLMRRVAELERLSAAGRAIVAAQLDIAALCALIAQEAGQVIDNRTFQVGLFDGDSYRILFWTVNGLAQETPQVFDLSQRAGIIGHVRRSGQPLLVRDFQRQMADLPATPSYVSQTPARAALFIPLISGQQTIGVMAAQSQQPGRFTEQDMRRLTILANQAAAAIASARLYQQAQSRAAQLELVRRIARQVNAAPDPQAIFAQVVQLTRDMFGFEPVNIFGIDPASGEAYLAASSMPALAHDHRRVPAGRGLVGASVTSRQTILANDTRQDQRFLPPSQFTTAELPAARAEMAIPLLVNEEVLGVLDVNSDRVGAFTAEDQTVLEALAAEVASAIHKAEQLQGEQQRAWITTAQLAVAGALRDSDTPTEIGLSISRLTPMLAGVSLCGLMLWDEPAERYRGCALHTDAGHQNGRFAGRECALGDWSALDAVHVGREVLTTRRVPHWLQPPGRALPHVTLYPIHPKGRTVGVLIAGPAAGAAPRGQAELLSDIARQTGRALENALLRQAQQEEAWVNTALLQVAEAVNNRIDLIEILDTIVRLVPLLVGVESTIVLIWDEERRAFRPGPSYGITPMGRGLIATLEIEPTDFPAMIQLEASTSPQAAYYSVRARPWMEKVLNSPRAHVFPLNARGRLVGAMVVGSVPQHGRTLAARRLSILNGIAHQAATAVVNNQLYQEAADRERLTQELNVAREIQTSLIPRGRPDIPGCSVASHWQAARRVSGDFYDFIPLPSGNWGIVVADVADKGIPAALFMALSRTILRTVALNREEPADVLMRVNDIIVAESRSDLFVTVFYAVWHPGNQTLVYANGGHNPPLLLRAGGQSQLLSGAGMALGVLPQIAVKSQRLRLQPDDVLIVYTDGVTEATNEDLDEFGLERLRLVALADAAGDAEGILGAITTRLQDHVGDTPQFDDITLVVLKRLAPPGGRGRRPTGKE